VGHSDQVLLYGQGIDYEIKVTLGITAWSLLRVHIVGEVRDLDVDSRLGGVFININITLRIELYA
jgi:hypothetical protein